MKLNLKDRIILWIARKIFKVTELIGDLEVDLCNNLCEKTMKEENIEKIEELTNLLPPGFWRCEVRGLARRLKEKKENQEIA